MREIKFRAWNKGINRMFSAEEMGEDELTINPDGRGFVNVNSTSIKLSQYYPHMIPLQYTGLKDKNGKEIYEDDICHDEHEHMNVAGVVRWLPKKAMFRLTIDDSGYGYPLEVAPDYYTVLGNIHENPELLLDVVS